MRSYGLASIFVRSIVCCSSVPSETQMPSFRSSTRNIMHLGGQIQNLSMYPKFDQIRVPPAF